MIVKETFSIPETLDFDVEGIGNGSGKNIAGSCELSFMKLNVLTAGSGVVRVYDGTSSSDENNPQLKLVMDASNTSPDSHTFSSPLEFRRGIWVRLDVGQNLSVILSYAVVLPH